MVFGTHNVRLLGISSSPKWHTGERLFTISASLQGAAFSRKATKVRAPTGSWWRSIVVRIVVGFFLFFRWKKRQTACECVTVPEFWGRSETNVFQAAEFRRPCWKQQPLRVAVNQSRRKLYYQGTYNTLACIAYVAWKYCIYSQVK